MKLKVDSSEDGARESGKPPRSPRIWSIGYWLNRLRNKELINAQVMLHLFVSRIHHPFKSYYHGVNGSAGEYASSSLLLGHNTGHYHESQESTQSKPSDRHLLEGLGLFRLALDANQWDWQGVPELNPLLRFYQYLSLIWVAYAFVKSLFGKELYNLVDRATQSGDWLPIAMPANCLFPGRFIFEPRIEAHCCLLFCIFHLTWRYAQQCMSRSYMLAPLIFLLQSDRDIEKFYKIMYENKHKNYLTSSSSRVVAMIDERSMATDSSGSMRKYSNPHLQIFYQNQHLDGSLGVRYHEEGDSSRLEQKHQLEPEVSVHESFFRHIMCYEVHVDGKIYYKLRPNRSWQSRSGLMFHLAASTMVASYCFLSIMFLATIVVCISAASDANYARLYPGCTPELSRKFQEAPEYSDQYNSELYWFLWFTQYRSFFYIGAHRLVALVFDLVESYMIWIDTSIGLTFVLTLGYLLNTDILLYWRHLHAKLENIVARMEASVHKAQAGPDRGYWNQSMAGSMTAEVAPVSMWRTSTVSRVGDQIVTSVKTTRISGESEAQLAYDINEFQFEMIDFFRQVEKADKMVSDIITSTLCFWMLSVAAVCYYTVKSRVDLPLPVSIIFAIGLVVLSLGSKYMLKLHSCCLKSYKLICTLMVHDQALTKEYFMRVLEFYGQRNRTTYTLFQRRPYKATTFISMIGWSLSCYFVIRSYFDIRIS